MSQHEIPRPARQEEWEAALQFLLRTLPQSQRDEQVAHLADSFGRGELDASGLLVLPDGRRLRGVLLYLALPGAAGLVWPPQAAPDLDPVGAEDLLVREAIRQMRDSGCRLGQALLEPADPSGEPLIRHGFARITTLLYLQVAVPEAPTTGPPGSLTFLPYSVAADLFHSTLFRTYAGTQDCPELTGVRTLDETLAGHRGQGVFDPDRWWVVCEESHPVGVILLNEQPDRATWDLSYLGVVPEARGRGTGRGMVAHALRQARECDVAQVLVAVDRRNWPARRLYQHFGFVPYEVREVYLQIWDRATP